MVGFRTSFLGSYVYVIVGACVEELRTISRRSQGEFLCWLVDLVENDSLVPGVDFALASARAAMGLVH